MKASHDRGDLPPGFSRQVAVIMEAPEPAGSEFGVIAG
jgi:hypothetical protein